MKKVFTEIGFGNDTFFSTEFEEGKNEYRIPKFIIPNKIEGVYLRFWVFKTMYLLSTDGGFEARKRERNNFKILFGISGESV